MGIVVDPDFGLDAFRGTTLTGNRMRHLSEWRRRRKATHRFADLANEHFYEGLAIVASATHCHCHAALFVRRLAL
jgi:hypothetical protein